MDLVRVGAVVPGADVGLPFRVVDAAGAPIEPVDAFLRDLMLSDASPSTCRSYAVDLLRWFRLLSMIDMGWERATQTEVALMVAWLRNAPNPQRRRPRRPQLAGVVNSRTGKPELGTGYARSTINHALTVVGAFYAFHARFGQGPVVNPVPVAGMRRRLLSHRSPLEPTPTFRRAPLRQKVIASVPRSIPDDAWDELFEQMGCLRDRALLACFVSSGARAEELLGITIADVDWPGGKLWVVSKGSRLREAVPVSPLALQLLADYLHDTGLPPAHTPVWRTRRGGDRPMAYPALRRVLQRANARLGTNWTLHDLRHTFCTRLAEDPNLTLVEVQTAMRHRSVSSTLRYWKPRLDSLIDKVQQHYQRPKPVSHPAPGYDPADLLAVFGG